jgi:hypothetical protein
MEWNHFNDEHKLASVIELTDVLVNDLFKLNGLCTHNTTQNANII